MVTSPDDGDKTRTVATSHHQADLGLHICGVHKMNDLWCDTHIVTSIQNLVIQPATSPTLANCFHIPEKKCSCEVVPPRLLSFPGF